VARRRAAEAIIFTAESQVAVAEVALPSLQPSDVLVRVEYSSVSIGTERWCLTAKHHPPGEAPPPFPFVPGYQAAGSVGETGSDVNGIEPGDRVFSWGGRLADGPVGSCWAGHVAYHVADSRSVIKLPDSVSNREASGLVLAQVGYNGATQPRVKAGDVALVIGDGLVGQYAAQVFRDRGAHVILSGHHDERLALAARHGADEVVNTLRDDLPAHIRSRWPDGVQVAAESASKNELVRTAIGLTEYHGQLVLLGYYPEGACMIDIHWLRERETTVYCPNALTRERLEATLALIAAGRMHVDELVTHEFTVGEAPKAYQMILDKRSPFLGVVFKWDT